MSQPLHCGITEVVRLVADQSPVLYTCDREVGHADEHHAYGPGQSELWWPNLTHAETPGIGRNVLLWIALGLLFWVIVIAIAVVVTR